MFGLNSNELPLYPELASTLGSLVLTTDGAGVTSNYLGLSFVATSTTLNEVNLYCSAATGATKLRVTIRPDSAGGPGNSSSVLSGGSVQKTVGLSTGFINIPNFTCTLVVGARYWIVAYLETDINQSITIQWATVSQKYRVGNGFGWSKVHGTNIDTLATSGIQGVAGYWVKYADGIVDGFPVSTLVAGTVDGVDRIYGSKGCGFSFIAPTRLNVSGVAVNMAAKSGAPTGTMALNIYCGSSLLAQSVGYPCATTQGVNCFGFIRSVELQPGVTYRCIVEETTVLNNISNYSKIAYVGTDTNYPTPFVMRPRKCSVSGGVFTEDSTKIPLAALVLDNGNPFPSPPLNRRQFNSMR